MVLVVLTYHFFIPRQQSERINWAATETCNIYRQVLSKVCFHHCALTFLFYSPEALPTCNLMITINLFLAGVGSNQDWQDYGLFHTYHILKNVPSAFKYKLLMCSCECWGTVCSSLKNCRPPDHSVIFFPIIIFQKYFAISKVCQKGVKKM